MNNRLVKKHCCESNITYNLEIIHRPMSEYEVDFIYFEVLLSHNVNLHSTLYLQQIYIPGAKSVRRFCYTTAWDRSLCKPITPFYYYYFIFQLAIWGCAKIILYCMWHIMFPWMLLERIGKNFVLCISSTNDRSWHNCQ